MKYVSPILDRDAFTCPYCDTLAEQKWRRAYLYKDGRQYPIVHGYVERPVETVSVSTCQACNKYHIWIGKQMIEPESVSAPLPSVDMPKHIKDIYIEARSIADKSPKAAAALLRLALQELCIHLGGKGKNINEDIASFVKSGLDVRVQKALDIVRITGNNAVHPGELNLDEKPEIAVRLFGLLNLIVSKMITEPKELDSFFDEMPEGAREAIEKRDGNVG